MPNGKPGDHPITDITVHGMRVYSPSIDALIRQIVELGGRDRIERMLFLNYNTFEDPDLVALEAELSRIRDALKSDAEGRGWEPR